MIDQELYDDLYDRISLLEMTVDGLVAAGRGKQSTQEPDKPSGQEPMPEAVEVWLGRLGRGFAACGPQHENAIGPYKIIPGMMSLDELAKHDIRLYVYDREWRVSKNGITAHKMYPNSNEAQWAATCLAKGA